MMFGILYNFARSKQNHMENSKEETSIVEVTPHCSQCRHYTDLPEGFMWCYKLNRRITARKRPCQYYCE